MILSNFKGRCSLSKASWGGGLIHLQCHDYKSLMFSLKSDSI